MSGFVLISMFLLMALSFINTIFGRNDAAVTCLLYAILLCVIHIMNLVEKLVP